jgi:tRNA pseudouridine13 synthase
MPRSKSGAPGSIFIRPVRCGDANRTGRLPALEAEVVAHHDVLARGLSKAGLEAERRALRIRVDRLAWAIEGEVVQLRFRLFRGAFATAVLHELLENAFAQDTPEAEE